MDETFGRLCARINQLLPGLLEAAGVEKSAHIAVRQHVAEQAWEDLCALAARDAAAGNDPAYVFGSYTSFQAVLAYRIAHELLHLPGPARALRTAARRLSERAKVRTGVEIHPSATIGRRFVIDHGFGTVIGEQTRLGDDCYLLQGVILGGPSIGHSSAYGQTRRHPYIGDRVEVGGGASVFGPVTVGDDCRIESGVRVTFDIPDGACIRLVSTTQICLTSRRAEVHSIAAVSDGLMVTGVGLANLAPALLDQDRSVVSRLPVAYADERSIRCGMPKARTNRARLLGLFEGKTLACFVAGAGALRDM